MKILVTGALGFIGVNYLGLLFEKHPEDEIVGIDALTYAANPCFIDLYKKHKNFTFYKADICDRGAMDEIFFKERPDTVVNFAAESHVDNSILDPSLFLRTNVLGVEVLLDASKRYGIKRFHQVSTDEVYGDTPTNSEYKFNEDGGLMPSSPYSASKAAADLLTLAYRRTHGLSVSISRSANNLGEYQHTEKLIPKIICRAMRGLSVPIYGDGENIRNWIYVRDNCEAIDRIARYGRDGEIYNVGGDYYISNIALARKILKMIGKPESLIEFVEDRKGHDRRYAIDCGKIKNELGFSAETPFNEALEKTVRHYLSSLS